MPQNTEQVWSELQGKLAEIRKLSEVVNTLSWDQQVNMPPAGGPARGSQIALLSRLMHERTTHPRMGELLLLLNEANDLSPIQQAGVRNGLRSYNKARAIPADLAARLAEAETMGFERWMEARKSGSWADFSTSLTETVNLVRQRALAIAPDAPIYDTLLDDYDAGTTETLRPMFSRLRAGLIELLDAVRGQPQVDCLTDSFSIESQLKLNKAVAEKLGFSFERGRLDFSEHPFTCGVGPGDVRITTRLYVDDLLSGLGGTLHEAGHGMYEQGLPRGARLDSHTEGAASLGVHESQSRFWENFIGRSRAFCEWLAPHAREHLGRSITAEQLFLASNRVEPGLIRVTADEATYNNHILARFELENALFSGEITVADLPQAWNQAYTELLGTTPTNDVEGVLQDVHWATGAFGYFPTYTLGNLYAASLGTKLLIERPTLWDEVARGEFAPTLQWLHERIHQHGQLYIDRAVIVRAVGERDGVSDLMGHLWDRQGKMYGLSR